MPGVGEKTQRGFEGFQFIQDKYQCDSSSVEITDSKGDTYSIEYLKDVGSQLKEYGCETGVVTIKEKTIFGDKSEYEAVYINDGDITASVDVSCYKGGEIEDTITVTKDDVIDDLHVEGFSIASVVDELDPYDLILITCPDNSEAYFAADEEINGIWSTPGDYTVKIVNRLGYYFSFKITVDESDYTSVSVNGEGTEATQDLYVRKGESNIKLPKLHRYGYNLEGYVDSDGNVYKDNTSNAKFNKSVVLEPIWKAKHFTVAFEDVNGDMISSYETSFGKEIVFPELSAEYVDDFIGWSLDGQSVGDKYRLDQENDLVFKMVTKGSRKQ